MILVHETPLTDGDVVRTTREPGSRWEVVAVHEDKCWLRDPASGEEQIIALALCARERVLH